MAAALYNRYRPRTFAEVVGQSHVTEALITALSQGRTHHAYLFSGPRGCGKTSSARILAASLNCVQGPTPTPCGVCEQCTSIRDGSSLDLIELDAASHGGVDDTRDLRERTSFSPVSARYRVFILDEAHMISPAGFNALLKVVEEPPDHLVFVFATTEPDKVLATIRSRTFSYAFRLVPPAILREHLASICAQEGVEVAPEVLSLVVRAGGGSVRDALSVLDQLISGGATDLVSASALLGVTDVVLLDDVMEALSTHDGTGMFGVVERVVAAGHDPRRFTADLLERLRDLVLLQAVPSAAERGLVEGCPPDQLDRMRHQAEVLGAAELSRSADVVHAGLLDMRGTTSPRLLLELVCARLLLPAADGSAAAVLARLDAVERRMALSQGAPLTSGQAPAPVPPPTSAPAAPQAPARAEPEPAEPTAVGPERVAPEAVVPEAVAPEPVVAEPAAAVTAAPVPRAAAPGPAVPVAATGAIDTTGLTEAWPLILDAVKSQSRVPHAMLSQHARVSAVEGQTVSVAISNPAIARQFQAGTGMNILSESLTQVVGGIWRIVVVVEGPGSPGAPPTAGGPVPAGPPSGPAPSAHAATADEPESGGSDDLPAEAAPDPLAMLKSAFGATVIEEREAT